MEEKQLTKLTEIITTHHIIKSFVDMVDTHNNSNDQFGQLSPILVGGAIVDILEVRAPKDYDFQGTDSAHIKLFEMNGYNFLYESSTAITLSNGSVQVQFIKTPLTEFDFKISQSTFDLQSSKLTIDENSFNSKTLIPLTFDKTNRKQAIDALRRIPHWNVKGYTIHPITYQSILSIALKQKSNKYNS